MFLHLIGVWKFQWTTLIVFTHNLLSSTYFWYFRSATLLKNQLKDQQAAENAANGSGGGGHKSNKPSFHALWEQEFRKIHPNSTFTSNNLSVHFWTWRKQQVNNLFGVFIKPLLFFPWRQYGKCFSDWIFLVRDIPNWPIRNEYTKLAHRPTNTYRWKLTGLSYALLWVGRNLLNRIKVRSIENFI